MFAATLSHPADFDGWREAARIALSHGLTPEAMSFVVEGEGAPVSYTHLTLPTTPYV